LPNAAFSLLRLIHPLGHPQSRRFKGSPIRSSTSALLGKNDFADALRVGIVNLIYFYYDMIVSGVLN
jgi:hypothetical protein